MRFVAFFVLIATVTTSQALQLPFPNFRRADVRFGIDLSFALVYKEMYFPNDASRTVQEVVDNLNGQLQSCAALHKVKDLKGLLRMIDTPAIPASCDPTVLRTRVGYYYILFLLSDQYLETRDLNGYDSSASSSLKTALTTAFGSFQGFSDGLVSAANAVGVGGSVWLCIDSKGGLAITATAGLDNPLMEAVAKPSCTPIFRPCARDVADNDLPELSLDLSYVDWKVVSDRFAAAVPPKPKAGRPVGVGNQCGGIKGDGCQLSGGKRQCTDAPWDGFQCETGLTCVRVYNEYWQCRPIGSNWGRKLAL